MGITNWPTDSHGDEFGEIASTQEAVLKRKTAAQPIPLLSLIPIFPMVPRLQTRFQWLRDHHANEKHCYQV